MALAVISVIGWQNFNFGPILMPRSLTVSVYGSFVVDRKNGCDKQCGPSSKRLHLEREMVSCQSIDHSSDVVKMFLVGMLNCSFCFSMFK